MSSIEETVQVCVPLQRVYNQWTQFEEFPKFMEGVEEVRQLDDAHLHWRTKIAGVEREFETEIVEQIPDERITWRSTAGVAHEGTVSFEAVGDNESRVRLEVRLEPHGVVERAADALGIAQRRMRGDLDRFRALIEQRGHESGAWRGEIHGGQPEGRFSRGAAESEPAEPPMT